jgi:D-3-phosphoglycerate dehydrogenase
MRELTVGLIGFGEIGQLVAKKLSGFDTSVQVYDPYVPSDVIEESGAIPTSLERLLETSDVVSLHARHTHGLPPILGKKELEMLKSNAYVINTARAGLLDMDALVDLLKEKKILGAAIDVFENEPIDRNHPILSLPNVTLTSHIAFDTASFYNRSPILWLNGLNEAVRDNNTRTCINFSDHVKVKLEQLKSLWTMKHLTL